ncbi:MAG TPA: enoyl-CoA hydratase/isomerase family protein [Chitinophagaceae bacterium]|nr:enoyl-CoA hydratase/isomerase family protein [Chitinophagaceae bacterium]
MSGHVITEIHNGLAVIEFFHPQSNSLPAAILKQLAEAIAEADQDPQVKLIILKSKGEKAFCAGASFDELKLISNEDEGRDFFMGFAGVINAMRRSSKFIIGRVQGKCVGGGVGMAAAVDICFATTAADVKLSELAVGIGPFVVGPAVERKIGLSAFSQLAIQATEWKSAEWARTHGLFAGLYPDVQELDLAVDKLAQTLVQSNPDAMREMKKMFWQGTEHWEQLLPERAAISGKLVLKFTEYVK